MKTPTPETAQTVPSLAELMGEAYHLSLSLCYATIAPGGHYFDAREDARVPDSAWSWADGLVHKFYEKRASGECSLQAMIDFDVAAFEAEVIADIATFRALLSILGEPRRLTEQDMRERGYRGSEAGYTPEEDRLFYLEQARAGLAEAQAREIPSDDDDAWYKQRSDVQAYSRMIAEHEADAL